MYLPHRNFFLIIFYFCALGNIRGQEYPFNELTSENGLPHSLVFDMFQDRQQYIWFATNNGIGKYDGHSFENFYDSDGLEISQVLAVAQTGDGKIWAATFGGGLHYLENGRFKSYRFPASCAKPKNIFKMIPGDGNRLYLLDNFTSIITLVDGEHVESIDMSAIPGLPVQGRRVNTISCAPGNGLWIGSDDGLFRRENNGKIFRAYESELKNLPVHDLFLDSSKNLWIATRGSVIRSDSSGKLQSYDLFDAKTEYIHLAAGSNGIVWVSTDKNVVAGINSRSASEQVMHISLSSLNVITDLLVDHEQNLWVSTYGYGVRCYYNYRVENYSVEDGLSSNFVRRIFPASDSTMWLATYKSSSFISYIRNDSVKKFPFPFSDDQNNVFAISEITPGTLLFALSSNEIISRNQNGKTEVFNRFPALDLLADKKGRLWIGSYNTESLGVPYLENGNTFYLNDPSIYNRRINTLKLDNTENLWIGTDSGLFCYHDKERVALFSESEGLSYRTILDLAVDAGNNLWIVTGKGIDRINQGEKNCVSIAIAPRGIRYTAITVDKIGNVWVGSSSGLYFFDKASGIFIPYRKGINGNEISCLTTDLRNRLWIGTARGVSLLLPGNESLPAPPIYITHITMNGKNIPIDSSGNWKYSENTVEVFFTGISYAYNKTLTYKYKLNGGTGDWKETNTPHLLFSNLAPGEYSLDIKAVLPDGTESSNTAHFSFNILPPFWMSAWFISCAAILIGSIIILFFRWRLAVVRKQAQEKFSLHERMVELEQQAASAMMHPHFIFNALNSVQSYISRNDPDNANRFLSRFSKLIRLTLENTYKKQVGLDEELERLELYLALEKSRYLEQFNYKITLAPEIDPHDISIPSLIIQPFVENAIWHGIIPTGRVGHIEISISSSGPDHIRILICDDGIGIDAAEKRTEKITGHKSLGISLTRERMELLGEATGKKASITITDRSRMSPAATGTCVEILIPHL